jgi:hypothetical protein
LTLLVKWFLAARFLPGHTNVALSFLLRYIRLLEWPAGLFAFITVQPSAILQSGSRALFSLMRSTPHQPKKTAASFDLPFLLQKNRRFTKAFSSRENFKMRYNSHQTVKLSTHCLSCTAILASSG